MFVRSTNPAKRIEAEKKAASAGYRQEHAARTWEERAPSDEVFEQRKEELKSQGIQAAVGLWVSGNEQYPDSPLIGLEVRPMSRPHMILNRPPSYGTPWHISVGFASNPPTAEQEAFTKKYAHPRVLTLYFHYINDKGYAELDPDKDPIASDPVVKAFHKSSYYSYKELHISL